jgi:predicted nuclease with TOPRIM domain
MLKNLSNSPLELSKVHTQISDLKYARAELKERIEALEKKWETGLIPDSEVKAAKAAMEEVGQREQSLVEREPQLTAELNAERGNLEALKMRLSESPKEI